MDKLRLEFDSYFWKEEVREGYTVTEKQKKIWAVELDLASKLIEVCQKHGIRFIVYAGTLLGAVRHKGFIPWDDDLDIAMDRENFNRLLAVAAEEFQYPYFLQTALSDRRIFLGYARLRNSSTTGIITGMEDREYNNGIYIDVYVIDGSMEGFRGKKQHFAKIFWARFAGMYYCDYRRKNLLKRITVLIARSTLLRFVSYESVIDKFNQCLARYDDSTDRLAMLTHSRAVISKYWCMKKNLEETEYVPFENIMVPIPKDYDRILRNMYGDYMEFPPVEKRGAWHEGVITFDPDIPYREYFDRNFPKE